MYTDLLCFIPCYGMRQYETHVSSHAMVWGSMKFSSGDMLVTCYGTYLYAMVDPRIYSNIIEVSFPGELCKKPLKSVYTSALHCFLMKRLYNTVLSWKFSFFLGKLTSMIWRYMRRKASYTAIYHSMVWNNVKQYILGYAAVYWDIPSIYQYILSPSEFDLTNAK